MVGSRAAPGEGAAGAELPMEPVQNRAQEPEKPGAPEQPAAEKTLSLRPALLRVPPGGLGYGSFRCRGSEQPPASGAPAAAARPQEGEAAPAAPAAWAPVELQVDVRLKPAGAPGPGPCPSPAPAARFFSVSVPDSPAFSRHSSLSRSGAPRTPSPGSTWGGWAGREREREREQRGRAAASEGESPPEPPRCRCRCRELGLGGKEWAQLLPGSGAEGGELHQAIARIGLPTYMKSLRWALAIMAVLLAVSVVTIVALASTAGAKCRPCPEGWIWSEEHCYYHSMEGQSWEDSKAFCSAHQASLPVLSRTQDFLSRYPIHRLYWVGLHRGAQGWHWIDGAPLPPQILLEEDEGNLHNRNCGGLEEGKLKALECTSPRPWICVRGAK